MSFVGMLLKAGINVYGTKYLELTNATIQRAIDIQITPSTADRMLYMDIDYGSNSKEAAYVISSSAKTSGETTAIRARGQGKAVGASTAEIRGVHAQGIAFSALYSGTVNAIYAEAIAKGTSTVTTIRGAMIACDSEGTPTSITDMYGAHIRVKTSVAPSGNFVPLWVETEKFGSGHACDAMVKISDATWTAGETTATLGIFMNTTGRLGTAISITCPTDNAIDMSGVTVGTNTDGSLIKAGTNSSRVAFSTASQRGLAIYLDNTATSGTLTGMRLRCGVNPASSSNGVDCLLTQVSVESGKDASTVNVGFFELIPKGTNTITTGRGLLVNLDSAASQTMTTQAIAHLRMHTRGDESITNDYMLLIENEAVGGNGRKADAWITFKPTSLSGGITGADYLLDGGIDTTLIGTAVLRLPDDSVTAWSSNTGSGDTEAGAIKVVIGSATRYIVLYSDAPT